jgi:hypothetical protein
MFRVNSYKRDEGFEPLLTETEFARIKKDAPTNASSPLLTNLAGDESLNWHHLVADFILVGQRLERLGFIYHRGTVIVMILDDTEKPYGR